MAEWSCLILPVEASKAGNKAGFLVKGKLDLFFFFFPFLFPLLFVKFKHFLSFLCFSDQTGAAKPLLGSSTPQLFEVVVFSVSIAYFLRLKTVPWIRRCSLFIPHSRTGAQGF